MKNKLFYRVMAGIALAVCLVFAGCPMEAEEADGLPSTKGKFTLTGASKADGRYAFFITELPSKDVLLGITDSNTDGTKLKGAQIKKGTAKIPLYVSDSTGQVKGYGGDDTGVSIKIFVSGQKEIEIKEGENITVETYVTFRNVTFVGGKVEKDIADASADMLQ